MFKNRNQKVDLDNFEAFLTEWGYCYHELAGLTCIGNGDDYDFEDDIFLTDCDVILEDNRCDEGTYAIDHECHTELHSIRLANPSQAGIVYSKAPKKRAVSTYELARRYFWLTDLFSNREHVEEVCPLHYNSWESKADINASFNTEIEQLANDPWLAMYWLLHMGLSHDERYELVKEKILALNLEDSSTNCLINDRRLYYIKNCFAWFEQHDVFYNMPLETSDSELFLKRRAYLLFSCHSYEYATNDNGFDKWWLSILIYPKAEPCMIQRMRWLWRNLDKYNKWSVLEAHLSKENTADISLLSYVLALNPNEAEKSKYADKFVDELVGKKRLWKDEVSKSFARVMIHHLNGLYANTETLNLAMKYYFSDDEDVDLYNQLRETYPN